MCSCTQCITPCDPISNTSPSHLTLSLNHTMGSHNQYHTTSFYNVPISHDMMPHPISHHLILYYLLSPVCDPTSNIMPCHLTLFLSHYVIPPPIPHNLILHCPLSCACDPTSNIAPPHLTLSSSNCSYVRPCDPALTITPTSDIPLLPQYLKVSGCLGCGQIQSSVHFPSVRA